MKRNNIIFILLSVFLAFSLESKAEYSGITWQEKSYAGRGNSNEPLLKLQFTYTAGESPTIGFTPYFNNEDITAIKIYARAFPSSDSSSDDNVFYLNNNGTEYDLAIFDYRDPINAPRQRVVYCGKPDGSVASGESMTYTVNADKFGTALSLSEGDKYFVYVTADISDDAAEFDNGNSNFTPNYIGATLNTVTDSKAKTTYTGSILTAFPAYENVNYPTSISSTTDDQYKNTRRILKERHMVFAPYDGYSYFYRIPGLSDASDGTLLLTADARKRHNHDARNDFDVLCKTSKDNGRTWSNMSIIAQGEGLALEDGSTSDNNCQTSNVWGYGDCAVAQTGNPRHMVAAFIAGAGLVGSRHDSTVDYAPNVCYVVSENAGETWSEVRKIDASLVTSYAAGDQIHSCPGPGRMLYVTSGPLAGKVLLVLYNRLATNVYSGYNWDILAYDESSDTWANVGSLGLAVTQTTTSSKKAPGGNNGGGGSGNGNGTGNGTGSGSGSPGDGDNNGSGFPGGNDNGGTTTTTLYSAMADYPGESQLVQVDDNTFLMTSRDDKASTYRHWFKLTLNDEGIFTNTTSTRVDLTEGNNSFGEGALACNSNFFIYELDGKKYLVQAMPTSLITRLNASSSTRSKAYLKYCDLTDIISGNSTELNWANSGLNLSLGQATSGYTCVSPQSDGSIGIAVEEYPVVYQVPTADNCGLNSPDILLSMWYMSTTIDNLSEGTLAGPVENRTLVPPTIVPSTCSIVKEDESKEDSALKFDYNGGAPLTDVTIVVNNADRIEYTESDQGYAIVYSVTYIPVETKVSQTLLENVQGTINSTSTSFDLKALLAENEITIQKNDQIIVTAKTVIISSAGGIAEESAVKETATYTYRTPTRSVIIKKMPQGANGKASLESLSYDNENQLRYYEYGSTIDIFAYANDKGTEFLGFTTDSTNDDYEKVSLSSTFLPADVTQPALSNQRHIRIPTLEEYAKDIVIYAWFKENEGGIHVGGNLTAISATMASFDDDDDENTSNEAQKSDESSVAFCTTTGSEELSASSIEYSAAQDGNFDPFTYRTSFANGIGYDDHILVPPSAKYEYSQVHLTLTADYYSYKRSAVVACWYRHANSTTAAISDKAPFSLMENPEEVDGYTPGAVYRYIKGLNQADITENVSYLPYITTTETFGTESLTWAENSVPSSVTFDFQLPHIESVHGYYGINVGYIVIYLVDEFKTAAEITDMLESDLAYVNDTNNYQSMLLRSVPSYTQLQEELAAREAAAAGGSSQQARRKASATAQTVVENNYDLYLNRVMIPIELEIDRSITTGVENVATESFTVVGLNGEATFSGNGNIIVSNILGQTVAHFSLDGSHRIHLAKGIYIANGKKFIVK